MADRFTLLDKWKTLQRITLDRGLARNDLIVALALLDRHHDAVGGARASILFVAAVTALSRTRVQSSLKRLVKAGHFVVRGGGTGTRGRVFVPTGPTDGASGGPSDVAPDGTTGPTDAASSSRADVATSASSGPTDGANKSLRVSLVVPRRGKPPLDTCASRPASPDGAPSAALASRKAFGNGGAN